MRWLKCCQNSRCWWRTVVSFLYLVPKTQDQARYCQGKWSVHFYTGENADNLLLNIGVHCIGRRTADIKIRWSNDVRKCMIAN